ncbi:AraC family transcriptional regulator [Novosphingobium sp. PC22D]|nr:AraC family transcriptional regulator [Novosphingobium sp. PC22D]
MSPGLRAQIVRFDIAAPTASLFPPSDTYYLNMCLTPRPPNARAGYRDRWGPTRLEPLGDIVLLPPGETLFIGGGSGRQASLVCELDPAPIHEIVGQRLEWDDQHLAATLDISSARIRALLFRLTEEVRHPGLASARMIAFLNGELAVELGRYCLEVAERPITGGLAGWRLRLIDERLAADAPPPTLSELADLCAISVRQLTRGFKVSRSCSIGDHVEQRRMEAAKRRLMAGESVKTIAFALGFASPSSFAFAFRRAVGTTPSAFRDRQGHFVTRESPVGS